MPGHPNFKEGPVGLITIDDLDARRISYADAAQAQAAIDDATAVARSYVEPLFDHLEAPDTPAAVVVVVTAMVRRVLTNPNGLNMEVLGDYTYQTTNAVATLLPTARERRMLRKAAAAYGRANALDIPAWGAGGVYMQTEVPYVSQDELGIA